MAMRIQNFDNRALALGDNRYETRQVAVPANTTLNPGEIMAGTSEVYPQNNTEPRCVLAEKMVNNTGAQVVMPGLVITGGMVNRSLLTIEETSDVDTELCDALRDYGIIAVDVRDQSVLDNQ